MKNERKLIVGTEEGSIEVWIAGDWGNVAAQISTLHNKHSISQMLPISPDRVITCADDGIVRCNCLFVTVLLSLKSYAHQTDSI